MADDALPWWGLRDPSSAQLIRWHWSTARLGTTSLAGLDDLTQRLAGPGERARRALLALPALALPAASLAGVGSAATPTSPVGAQSASPAVAAQALSETTCLQRFGGTAQSLGLRAEGHALSVSVRYECRLAGGSLQPLSGLPVAVHVTSAGRTSVLDAHTDAEGWASVYLSVPSGGVVSVVADVPGFPASTGPAATVPATTVPAGTGPAAGGPTRRAPLGLIAGARSGDKGGNANLGVWARDPAAFAWLDGYLTAGRLTELVPGTAGLRIERYRLPNLLALNFVVVGLLGRGVAASTRLDPQAKALGEELRAALADIPEALLGPPG